MDGAIQISVISKYDVDLSAATWHGAISEARPPLGVVENVAEGEVNTDPMRFPAERHISRTLMVRSSNPHWSDTSLLVTLFSCLQKFSVSRMRLGIPDIIDIGTRIAIFEASQWLS